MVKHVAADLYPEVMESVTQQSALSGEPAVDKGAVLEALKAAIEKRSPEHTPRKRAEKSKGVKKAPLWDEPEKGDDAKQGREEPRVNEPFAWLSCRGDMWQTAVEQAATVLLRDYRTRWPEARFVNLYWLAATLSGA